MSFNTMANFAGSWNTAQNAQEAQHVRFEEPARRYHTLNAQEAQHVRFEEPTRSAAASATPIQRGTPDNRGRVPQRKPVGSSSRPSTPRSGSSVPARKPVGSGSAGSSMSRRTQSPAASTARTPINLNKPLPPSPAEGLHCRVVMDPAPVTQPPMQPPASRKPSSTPPVASRPSSSGGWSFRSFKRTNSNASSTKESATKSRSNSLTSAAKKTGKWITGSAGIMAMNAQERDDYRKVSLEDKERKREHKRNQNPSSRPLYEKRFLTGLTKDDSRVITDATFDAHMQHRVSRERRSADLKRRHERDCAEASRQDQAFQCEKCAGYSLKYLKGGLCPACYTYYKYTDSREPSLKTRKKGHNPISPEDDAHGGDLYIRLSAQHRLRKVRGTVYADPGNPFDSELFETPLLPSTTYGQDSDGTDNSDTWDYQVPEVLQNSGRSQMTSMFSDPFDLVDIHDDASSNRESLGSLQSTRRSMSVDIGFLPAQNIAEQNYDFDSEKLWHDGAPVLHIPHPSGTVFTTSSKRNTQFYEFYDGLLAEYGIEQNSDEPFYI